MRSSLRNKLSDLNVIIVRSKSHYCKVSIIDETSMVSNDLLFHVRMRVTLNDQSFAGVSVGDFQLPPVGGELVYANYKNNWQSFNSLWRLFKIFELTEVIQQRGDSQLIDILNNVRTGDVQPDDINILKSRVI